MVIGDILVRITYWFVLLVAADTALSEIFRGDEDAELNFETTSV